VKLAIDTNVLVRYLTADVPGQAAASTRIMEGGDNIVISSVVLCETVWVPRRPYKYERE
jgi:predicted nucleic-acid-binding protein